MKRLVSSFLLSSRLLASTLLYGSLVFATPAHPWPHAPNANVLVAANSTTVLTASDGSNGCFAAYYAYHDGTNGYDVLVQHYDSAGNALWGTPVDVCNVVDVQYPRAMEPDGAGGVVIAWQDYRTNATTGSDLYIQRLNSSGAALWTANGVVVCNAVGTQDQLRMVLTSTIVYCVWQDARTSATTSTDIYAQGFSLSTGTAQFAANGALVCNATGVQSTPDVTVDDGARAFCVWGDARTGSSDIYGQLLQYNGAAVYTANGIALCSAAGEQTSPRAKSFPGNYAFVVWTDGRGVDYDVYAQRFSLSFQTGDWGANGKAVCTATGSQRIGDVVRDLNGYMVVVWTDGRDAAFAADLYAQKMDSFGNMQWAANGVAVRASSTTCVSPRIVSDRLGGTVVGWQEYRVDTGDIYAQRLSASGATMWTSTGVPVCTASSNQTGVQLCETTPGGVIAAWDDNRPIGYGTHLQGVDAWGYLGAEPTLASVKDIPNDQGGQVKVSWYGSPLDTDPLFWNVTDYIVYRAAPTRLATLLAARSAAAVQGAAAGSGAIEVAGRRFVTLPNTAQDYFWEELAHVTPRHLAQYGYVAATEGDSVAGSNPRTAFMVMAVANTNTGWWVSKADSGYSVDNLAPLAPAPFTGQYGAGTTALHWMPNAEADLAGYRIYRGSSAAFTPSLANRVAAVPDTGYADVANAPYFYKVTAIDTHGNESPVATLMPSGTLAVDGGATRAMFAAPAPNPLRGGAASTLRFALAVGGRTKLALYDAQGRVARVLVDGALEPGEHAVTLKGDGLAPGLYLARLESPGFTATRRVMVVD